MSKRKLVAAGLSTKGQRGFRRPLAVLDDGNSSTLTPKTPRWKQDGRSHPQVAALSVEIHLTGLCRLESLGFQPQWCNRRTRHRGLCSIQLQTHLHQQIHSLYLVRICSHYFRCWHDIGVDINADATCPNADTCFGFLLGNQTLCVVGFHFLSLDESFLN